MDIKILLNQISPVGHITIVFVGLVSIALFLLTAFARKFDYKGKHVLITGGSSGIGLEVAKEYLERGANVTIMARDAKKLESAKAALVACDASLAFRVCCASGDISTSVAAVTQAISSGVKQFGDVDVLVNCAGISVAGEFDQLEEKEFERMLKVNVLGSVYPTRAVLEGMKKKRAGRIVFVASQVAQVAIHGYSAYGASKWALRGLAEALQMELRPYGILVSVSYPPDTDTPGYKEEMLTKPHITRALSEAGQVFSAKAVAQDLVNYSTLGYFGISTGLDGWLLKQLHPGMSPVNTVVEALQQICFASLARAIAICYVISWDGMVKAEVGKQQQVDTEGKKEN